MITLEHEVLASPEQMEFIIEGMRNPMNSWDKMDSECCAFRDGNYLIENGEFMMGPNDLDLMKRLAKSGTDHRKFMRMMPVYVRITAPLYWWKEFDTYKVGTVANSCSTMHKIQAKEFDMQDFSYEHIHNLSVLEETVEELNRWRDLYNNYEDQDELTKEEFTKKDIWWQMIQLLPSSYNQTRNVMMNYEVLANIYKSRRNHKLDEWHTFCDSIEQLPYSELIIGKKEDEGFESKLP